MEAIRTNTLLEKNLNLKESMNQFEAYFSKKMLQKNEFLVNQGEICPYFCFVISGILQHAITLDSEEKTTYLSLKNTFTSSLKSFLLQIPSRKSIKAIIPTELWVISVIDFKNLVSTNPDFHTFYYDLIERQICLIDDYRIDLLVLTPEERYKKLLSSEPVLLQEVPLHYLASFLGISSRHMSRIRKNIK